MRSLVADHAVQERGRGIGLRDVDVLGGADREALPVDDRLLDRLVDLHGLRGRPRDRHAVRNHDLLAGGQGIRLAVRQERRGDRQRNAFAAQRGAKTHSLNHDYPPGTDVLLERRFSRATQLS